MMMSVPITNIL